MNGYERLVGGRGDPDTVPASDKTAAMTSERYGVPMLNEPLAWSEGRHVEVVYDYKPIQDGEDDCTCNGQGRRSKG